MVNVPDLPDWTFMLYFGGDNNLSSEMIRALNDIGKVGVPKNIALPIQYDPVSPSLPTIRYFRRPETKTSAKSQAGPIPLAEFAEPVDGAENTANPKVMTEFITAAMDRLPAQRRMLGLSGHCSGAVGDFLADDSCSPDQAPALSVPKLRPAVLRSARSADEPDRILTISTK